MAGSEEVADEANKISVTQHVIDDSIAFEAAAANEAEKAMGLAESLKLYKKACLWSIFLSSCIIMEGFDNVLLSSLYAFPPFRESFGELQPDGTYQLTAAWQAGLNNGAFVGQITGLLIAGLIADRIGFRKSLILALALCTAFIFIIFFSKSLVQLLIGEIFIGLPLGVFQTLTCTYAAEVCPTHLRAYLTTYVNLCWVIGQFIASGVLRAVLSRTDEWGFKIPFALQWIWPVPLMIGIYFAPESPWWLVRKNRLEEAKNSLRRLTTQDSGISFNADEAVSMIVHVNELERRQQEGTSYFDLFKGVNLRRTEIVCFVWMAQVLCGTSFMGYSTYFYEQAGMSISNAFSMSLGLYAIGGVGTFVSWVFIKHFGRRSIYLGGQLALCALLSIIGGTAFAGRDNKAASWAIGSMLLVFAFIYNSTVGPICFSLVSELSSTRLRAKSVVMARVAYILAGIVSNIVTPRMLNPSAWNWGAKSGFFWAATCGLCTIWTFFRLPEPKGRTYGELDILFEQRVSARKFKTTNIAVPGSNKDLDDIKGDKVEMIEFQN